MAWQDFAGDTTEDLIEYIRWREKPEDKTTSDDAFIAFCFRFRDDVQTKCRIICRNRGYDNTIGDEIADATFDRFLKYPQYKTAKCKSGDTDKCVRLYLYGFAARILSDYVKAEKRGPNPFMGDEEIVTEYLDVEALEIDAERKAVIEKRYSIIKGALDRLTPKHKIIYLTYKQYEQQLKEGFNFPRSFLKKLQDELELTQSSIRVYKKEAFDKVEEYLNIYGKK